MAEETMQDLAKELEKSYEKLDKGFDVELWEKFDEMMKNNEVFTVTVEEAVKGGVVTHVDDVRAFIPASHLSASYVEDLNTFVKKELEVKIITAEPENQKLVLSAKEVAKAKQAKEKAAKMSALKEGSVLEGKVESIVDFGAFVDLGDGLSGLVHISQISHKRIRKVTEVLKEGQDVKVKVLGVKDGKISLSIKALTENTGEEEGEEQVSKEEMAKYTSKEGVSTSLGDILSKLNL